MGFFFQIIIVSVISLKVSLPSYQPYCQLKLVLNNLYSYLSSKYEIPSILQNESTSHSEIYSRNQNLTKQALKTFLIKLQNIPPCV